MDRSSKGAVRATDRQNRGKKQDMDGVRIMSKDMLQYKLAGNMSNVLILLQQQQQQQHTRVVVCV